MYTYCYSYNSFVRINFLETEISYIVTSETQSYHGNRIPYSGFFKKETFTNKFYESIDICEKFDLKILPKTFIKIALP